jgi:hypothetical protein
VTAERDEVDPLAAGDVDENAGGVANRDPTRDRRP